MIDDTVLPFPAFVLSGSMENADGTAQIIDCMSKKNQK